MVPLFISHSPLLHGWLLEITLSGPLIMIPVVNVITMLMNDLTSEGRHTTQYFVLTTNDVTTHHYFVRPHLFVRHCLHSFFQYSLKSFFHNPLIKLKPIAMFPTLKMLIFVVDPKNPSSLSTKSCKLGVKYENIISGQKIGEAYIFSVLC